MTECQFPLFRERFWAAAQWTEDTGDDQLVRQQQLQQQMELKQKQKHACASAGFFDQHTRSYEVRETNAYMIDENFDWLRASYHHPPPATPQPKEADGHPTSSSSW
eukprot:TRINITY_DN7869_c3_g1_i1.p4 TRINITY_DN7869_c3_g1~~TRINITY_DN7869_c3_g1_i1.p4  ORF type:complete len:106 (+),score=16.47 TRINITY_DN7869_c3_g1_i1:266-583(+)